MTGEDVRFFSVFFLAFTDRGSSRFFPLSLYIQFKFLFYLILGMFGVIGAILGVAGGLIWFFYLRAGAPFGDASTEAAAASIAAAAKGVVKNKLKIEL